MVGKVTERGFFHIFGANVINKFVSFFTNIAIVWFLSKESYGIFSYANSVYSIALLFTGFGLLTGMFQYCLENRSDAEKRAIYKYVFLRGLSVDCVLVIGMMAIGFFATLPIEQAGLYVAMFSPMLLFDYVFQYISTTLRIMLDNRRFAYLQSTNTIAYFILGCGGAYVGGIAGTILGRYLAYVVSVAMGIVFLRSTGFSVLNRGSLSKGTKTGLWKFSLPTQASSAINQLTYLLDVLLVGVFIVNASSVASYKVATILPEGLLFIPSSVIIFAMPYFVKHNNDKEWFKAKTRLFLGSSAGLYASIAIILVLLAPAIVLLLWGDQYADAIPAFRFLSASFFFSAIRTTCTNLLCTVRAVKENFIISICSLGVNVVLCLILIPRFGIEGAAVAPLTVSIIAAVIALLLLKKTVSSIGITKD